MIAADRPDRRSARLLTLTADGGIDHRTRADLATVLARGDLVVANDAATVPASLQGTHTASGEPIEVRLAAWVSLRDPTRFIAVAFGRGDHRTRTEERLPPPTLRSGDRLLLGPLVAVIETVLDHPRLVQLQFEGEPPAILAGLARHGRPIQYAYVPEPLAMWDVWTSIAAHPWAFEPPSAGFALDWRILSEWRQRDVEFASLTHAAGISSTGDIALDARFPLDEPYRIPQTTAAAIARAKTNGKRVLAVGTSVVRALEAAADVGSGHVRPGEGIARGRIGPASTLRVVDGLLTGVHLPGETHYEMLRAFLDQTTLDRISSAAATHGYRTHEFGDFMLIERQEQGAGTHATTTA